MGEVNFLMTIATTYSEKLEIAKRVECLVELVMKHERSDFSYNMKRGKHVNTARHQKTPRGLSSCTSSW